MSSNQTMENLVRLNKFLAEKGFATRRGADLLIEAKRVYVNGEIASLGTKVSPTDRVEIAEYKSTKYRYLLYYKPRGVITHSPAKHEEDIITRVMNDHGVKGVFPIGRLDKDSEGLILLTDDGRVTDRILNPVHGHERQYEVYVDKRITQTFLNALAKGVVIEGYKTKSAKTEPITGSDSGFLITLTEGKKHQIRRMCAALGYQVRGLKRLRMLTLELKNLKPGAYYALNKKESHTFLLSLGLVT